MYKCRALELPLLPTCLKNRKMFKVLMLILMMMLKMLLLMLMVMLMLMLMLVIVTPSGRCSTEALRG